MKKRFKIRWIEEHYDEVDDYNTEDALDKVLREASPTCKSQTLDSIEEAEIEPEWMDRDDD